MKNASASGSSKSQMLSSSLPLPASFFKVLPLPQKFSRFHRFRFHIPDWNWRTQNRPVISKQFPLEKSPYCFLLNDTS